MHLNYHFLKYLCPELEQELKGMTIISCFSQSKDELVIETELGENHRYIRAHFLPPQIYFAFPEDYKRAKRNSVDLFPELIGEKISLCKVLSYERAFRLELESGGTLLFKLHGNRSNVLHYQSGNKLPIRVFRNEFVEDKSLYWPDLEKPLDLSQEQFFRLEGNASQFLPTLGKIPREWLKERGYIQATINQKWALMQELLDMLDSPLFSLAQKEEEVYLTLLPDFNIQKTFANPVDALNELFYKAMVVGSFEKEKRALLKKYGDELKKTESYIKKSQEKLEALIQAAPPSQLADVIMAHIHEFKPGQLTYRFTNFYSGEEVEVKLKPNQKLQDYAENLYRKSKNRQLELDQIEQAIASKKVKKEELETKLFELENLDGFRDLKDFKKSHKEDKSLQKDSVSLPFRQFEYAGFPIWVGKSAKDNDEMLRNYIHKDDLWLHARQVPGSHVVIRTKGKEKVPNQVLEKAASLAAYYSKYKTESLAPVIYTEAKFVRKVKGLAPGAVMVDRESVIMVVPEGPSEELTT